MEQGDGVVDFDVDADCLNTGDVGDAVEFTEAVSDATGAGSSEINAKMEVGAEGVVLCSDYSFRCVFSIA